MEEKGLIPVRDIDNIFPDPYADTFIFFKQGVMVGIVRILDFHNAPITHKLVSDSATIDLIKKHGAEFQADAAFNFSLPI